MARTTVAHLFHSINGAVENPHHWQFDAFGPEEGEAMMAAISPVTDVVMGRKLWEEWSEFWPKADANDPFAQWINAIPKHVLSSSQDGDIGWNSTAISGDALEYIRQLRDGEGGQISVAGGIDTIRSLFLAGLIDELTLTTHPVVTEGRRLFDAVPTTRLQLLNSQTTSVGNLMSTYALRTES